MKLLIKLSLIILSGLPFFSSANPLAQNETITAKQQQSQTTLQEANKLFVEGSSTSNAGLIHQAKDKYSLWLNEKNNTANHHEFVQVLRSRASLSMALGDINDAISDYKKSNQYDPIGEIQLGICFLEKKQGAIAADLQACYAEAVQMFTDKQTSKTDINYLIARILKGDNTAITEYKSIVESAKGDGQLIYKMAAQEYLNEDVCKQILMKCERNNN